LDGVRMLCDVLFGVEVVVEKAGADERWCNDLLRLEFRGRGAVLGYVYLDLYARPGKFATRAAKLNV
jgi:Zn-dependent oligopeptidase